MPAAVRRSEWNSRVLMAQLRDAGPLAVVCEFIPGYMEGRRRVVLRMSLSAGDDWGVPLVRGCASTAVVSDEWELLFEVRRNRMSRRRYGPLLITSGYVYGSSGALFASSAPRSVPVVRHLRIVSECRRACLRRLAHNSQ